MGIRWYILSFVCALFSLHSFCQNELLLPVKSQGKWGYCDTMGTLRIPLQYETAGLFHDNGLAPVKLNGLSYLINQKGELITQGLCKDVLILNSGLYACFNGSDWKLHGPDYKSTVPYDIKALEDLGYGNWVIYTPQGAGLINSNAEIKITPRYDIIANAKAQGFYILYKDSLMGVANAEGQEVVPVQYLFTDFTNPGIIIFNSENNLGIISINGKVNTDTLYTDIRTNQTEPFVLLYQNEKCTAFQVETGSKFECDSSMYLDFFDDDYLMLYKPDGINLLDKNMQPVFKEQYHTIRREEHGFVMSRNKLFGYADSMGNVIHHLKYPYISQFIKGTAITGNKRTKGIIHESGTVIGEPIYDKAEVYSLTAKMYLDGKVNTVEFSEEGKMIDQNIYSNFMTVKLGGFRDLRKPTQTSDIAPPSVWFFSPDVRKWGLNSPTGEVVITPKFDVVQRINSNFTKVGIKSTDVIRISNSEFTTEYKWGLVNHQTGEITYPPAYADVYEDSAEKTIILVDFRLNYFIKKRDEKILYGPFTWIGNVSGNKRAVALGGNVINCGIDSTYRKISTVREYFQKNFPGNSFNNYGAQWRMNGDILLENMQYYTLWNAETQKFDSDVKYRYISDFTNGYARMIPHDGNNFGVINDKGARVVAPNYQHIDILKSNQSVFFLKYNKREAYGFVKKNGNWAFEKKFQQNGSFHDGIACMGKNDRDATIFVDTLGVVRELDEVKRYGNFSEGLIAIKQGKHWYYADEKLMIVLEEKKWNWLGDFHQGLAAVRETGKNYTYINNKGGAAFKGEFQKAMPFNEHGAIVLKNGNWGLINTQGKYIIKSKYNRIIYKPSDSLYHCYKNGKITLMQPNGIPLTKKKIQYMKNFVDGNTMATLINEKRILLRRNGTFVNEPKDMRMYTVQGDFVTVIPTNGKITLCNSDMEIISGSPMISTYKFGQEGIIFARERRTRKWTALGTDGKFLFNVSGTPISGFTQGYAIIRTGDGRKMYINTKGEQCFGTFFLYAEPFTQGYARVSTEKGWGVVDISGNFIIMPKYKYIGRFSDGMANVKMESLISISDNRDAPLVDGEYDLVILESFGFFRVESADRVGWISKTGRVVWNPAN